MHLAQALTAGDLLVAVCSFEFLRILPGKNIPQLFVSQLVQLFSHASRHRLVHHDHCFFDQVRGQVQDQARELARE